MDPGDESWNVEIPIPYYIGGKWGLLPWNLNIGIYTIKAELSKNSGSLINNTAKWNHNHSQNVNWSDDGAAATEKGYAGCCTMSYQYNRNYATTTSVTGSGSLDYSYSSPRILETFLHIPAFQLTLELTQGSKLLCAQEILLKNALLFLA